MPMRRKNSFYRSREYLTVEEVFTLIEVAGSRGRHRLRDRTLILLSFRHGLRASEAGTMRWDAVMLRSRTIFINRVKGSVSGTHPLQQDEIDLLSQMRKQYPNSNFVFPGERGDYLSVDGIEKMLDRNTEIAQMPIKIHPHMFRHSCGYHLANQGATTRDIQDYLGHKNIQHTVVYTAQNAKRFEQFRWDWSEK